jgi:hypothetical protein
LVSLQPPKQTVDVVFGNLNFVFDGAEKFASAFVQGALPLSLLSPEGFVSASSSETEWGDIRFVFTYNGLTTAPIDEGVYRVVAYVDDAEYSGEASSWMAIVGEDYLDWARDLFGTDLDGRLPAEAQPLFDADGDGVANVAEFYLGTNPRNAGSKFSTKVAEVKSGVVTLAVDPIAPVGTYYLQYTDSLTSGIWSEPERLEVVSGDESVELEIGNGVSRGFFRLIYVPPGGAAPQASPAGGGGR